MIPLDEARSLVLERAAPLPLARVPLGEALGAGLAEPLRARFDLPRFDAASMDGYGVRLSDVSAATPEAPVHLPVAGTVRAGDAGRRRLPPAAAFRVFTGGALPPGVEAVLRREDVRELPGYVAVEHPTRAGENVRHRGEEVRAGDEVLAPGTPITPPVLGLLAGFGIDGVRVPRRPVVSVVVTGSELTAPGRPLRAGRIFDANSSALAAALAEAGAEVADHRVVGDDLAATTKAVRETLDGGPDVLIAVGGVSVGDYDLVKDALESAGVARVFWRVAIKPGKPNWFGTKGNRRARGRAAPRTLVFGLPGNPVSALVSFLLLVRPALLALRGRSDTEPRAVPAILEEECRKQPGRTEWVRARILRDGDVLKARPLPTQGSHMLTGLAGADALVEFPANRDRLFRGETVSAWPVPWEGRG